MVESAKGYTPSDEERGLVVQHLGDLHTFDEGYNRNVTLKLTEAKARKAMVEEVEYDFQLALNAGEYYLGKATINFYLRKLPSDINGSLHIDFRTIAMTDCIVNDKYLRGSQVFKDQRINLAAEHV